MPTYAAFLGNSPDISLAELQSSIPDVKVVRRVRDTIAIISTEQNLTNRDLMTWGGIFLMAREIAGKNGINNIPELLLQEVENVKGKVTFSIRAYGVSKETVHRLYRDCKNALKKKGVPARYIGNEKKPPVSVQLHDEGLITGKNGCEIVVLGEEDGDFIWIGRTIAAQDPDAYTKRDMQKPVRDTRAGLLPPKLAQILLNFGAWAVHQKNAKAKEPFTILDPFCGTGVIPLEALLRGWPVLASDLSQKAVSGTEKNMEWIRKEEKILKRDVPSDAWKQDATKPFKLKNLPDVIVTETMLGPALDERPTTKDVTKYRMECDELEIAFLHNVAATLPGVPVVATFPVWYVKSGPVMLEKVWKQLEKIGYKAVLPEGAVASSESGRTSIIYRRSDQFVGREIVILMPVK